MDSLTHLVAGALTPLAFKNTPRRAALIGFGIAAGELPDLDIIFGSSPLALMTLHRGVTHALFWQPVMALLVSLPFMIWLCARSPAPLPLSGARPLAPAPAGLDSRGNPTLVRLWCMALIALYMHIYLDCMTTFGTLALLPFSEARLALPAMFIVDPLLTLPAMALLGAALWRKPDSAFMAGTGIRAASGNGAKIGLNARPGTGAASRTGAAFALYPARSRALALAALAWLLVYPLLALGANAAATVRAGGVLKLPGDPQADLLLMTEPLSPFVWKKIESHEQGWLLGLVSPFRDQSEAGMLFYKRPDPALYASLARQEALFAHFADFAPLMTQTQRPASTLAGAGHAGPVYEYSFADLRYLAAPGSLTRLVGRGDAMFVLEARVNAHGALLAWRFLKRGDDAPHSPWVLTQ